MEIEKFIIIGINNKNKNLEEFENIILQKPFSQLKKLYEEKIIKGYVFINTCFRNEIYFEIENISDLYKIEKVIDVKNKFYIKKGEEGVKKLFEVICGLDSIIKGEEQILSQLKKAYFEHRDMGLATTLINKIFNHAISLGKKFRKISRISCLPLSLEAITVKFIKKNYENIENKKIFLLGAGDLTCSILKILIKNKVQNISITNRTYHKLEKIIPEFEISKIDFHNKYLAVKESDIIISATSAPHLVIRFEDIFEISKDEKERLFIDLAVPRDIEPNIKDIKNIKLYNLEEIMTVCEENKCQRLELEEKYGYLIEEEILNLNSASNFYKNLNLPNLG